MLEAFRFTTFMRLAIVIIVLKTAGSFSFIQHVFANGTQSSGNTKSQAMPVEVAIIEERTIRLWKEFSGRLTAVDYVEIRPQATGLITEVRFKEGELVSKGDVLYIIDPRPLIATVAQENADLMAAQNRYALADKKYKRAQDLIKTNMISRQIYDERMNAKLVADSTVKRAQAELLEAKIKLSYAYVKAPISGRISRTELTEGNLVSAGPNAPLLTSIVSSEGIYAEFEVDEQTYLRYVQGNSSEKPAENKNPVELRLQNGDLMYPGKIHAFDNQIDSTSGTIRARAIFDNPQGKLLPGMYARLKLGSVSEEKAILIRERAIGTDQNRKFVYVVNGENKITYREVLLGGSRGGDRIVRSGLMVGEKVIVRGLMRVQPNMLVAPKVSTMAKTKAAKS